MADSESKTEKRRHVGSCGTGRHSYDRRGRVVVGPHGQRGHHYNAAGVA